jgi:RHS repeat-associated protein
VGQHYEKKGTTVTKYYFAGATRLAVRTNGTLSYLLGDHLGSSSVTTNASGVKTASALYKAFGETRYSSGALGTDYKFTGQREQAELGLYFYGARWFDPSIGRFTSADTMIPSTQGTQAWDRYAFVNNNPVRYNDPTGHMIDQGENGNCTSDADCSTSLDTYTLAGIKTVTPFFGNQRADWMRWVAINILSKENVSYGPAKLYPEEFEELGIDPQTSEGAFIGMQKRIGDRIDACTGCNDTDKFIVAALGSDHNFSVDNVGDATGYKNNSGPTTIDWTAYLGNEAGEGTYDKYMQLIIDFTYNVLELKSQGYYVPDVDFNYILNTLLP